MSIARGVRTTVSRVAGVGKNPRRNQEWLCLGVVCLVCDSDCCRVGVQARGGCRAAAPDSSISFSFDATSDV